LDDAELPAVGESALDRFIEAFNARDPASWAASLSYPHVRVSTRPPGANVTPDERAYADAVTYNAPDAMGWHHSAWDWKRILATSPTKIHASAQWCRYDSLGERILENNVSYVITEVAGRWGIQARFGVDSAAPEDPGTAVRPALDAWSRLLESLVRGDPEGIEAVVRLPLTLVGVGQLTVASTPAQLLQSLRESMNTASGEAEPLQIGRLGVNLGIDLHKPDGARSHALALVVLAPEGALVSAVSLLGLPR
jgi:hypothetical protein